MSLALIVMFIIILLNVGLLLVVMRLGTQGEHHSEFAADQSLAVTALRSRLAIKNPTIESHVDSPTQTSAPTEEATGASE